MRWHRSSAWAKSALKSRVTIRTSRGKSLQNTDIEYNAMLKICRGQEEQSKSSVSISLPPLVLLQRTLKLVKTNSTLGHWNEHFAGWWRSLQGPMKDLPNGISGIPTSCARFWSSLIPQVSWKRGINPSYATNALGIWESPWTPSYNVVFKCRKWTDYIRLQKKPVIW